MRGVKLGRPRKGFEHLTMAAKRREAIGKLRCDLSSMEGQSHYKTVLEEALDGLTGIDK